jgi:hypothetical protein
MRLRLATRTARKQNPPRATPTAIPSQTGALPHSVVCSVPDCALRAPPLAKSAAIRLRSSRADVFLLKFPLLRLTDGGVKPDVAGSASAFFETTWASASASRARTLDRRPSGRRACAFAGVLILSKSARHANRRMVPQEPQALNNWASHTSFMKGKTVVVGTHSDGHREQTAVEQTYLEHGETVNRFGETKVDHF